MPNYLKGTTPSGIACMGVVSIGAFLFGFDNGWWGTILGAQAFLRDYGSCKMVDGVETCNLSTPQLSAGSGVQSAGIMIGCLIAVYLNNLLGRKMALVTTGLISIIGCVIELTSAVGSRPGSKRFDQFVAGKVIASLSMGLAASIVPIYLAETSTGAARGFAVNMYQNIQIIGVLVATATVFATSKRSDAACYLVPMGLQLLAPVIMVFTCPFLPESPRWLIWKGRREDAVAAAKRLFATETNEFDAEEYIQNIHLAIEDDRLNPKSSSWADLLRGPDLRRVLIAVGIQSLQQAQGSSYMNNYIVSFLQSTGVKDVFPVIMGLYVLYYVAILTGHVLPDIVGRRVIIMSTATFCGVALLIVACLVTAMSNPPPAAQKASIALIFLWQASFGIQSPLIWITTAESAPSRNREKVLAVAVFFGFGISLLIASVSPYIQDAGYGNLGGRIGFIWGSFSIITVVWVFFMLPEMKGRTLEQLDYLYDNRVPTRKFGSYVFPETLEGEELAKTVEVHHSLNKEPDP